MKTAILILLASLALQMPKNNPNGVWESLSGTQYQPTLQGPLLKVRLIPGSNPKYTQYEIDLQNDANETNTYAGKGFFVAKVKEDKECKFETEWQIVVVSSNQILGKTTN